MKSLRILIVLSVFLAAGAAQAAGHPVQWVGDQTPGTIVILTEARRLYHVQDDGTAMSYPIAVGKEGAQWKGTTSVVRKAKWPDWRPTPSMRAKDASLPQVVPGGPGNPLGARALYLDQGLLRIHGNNKDSSIGKAASSGCFRMFNEDVEELYEVVQPGAVVIVGD
jgi:lipoprotein-anchoring transpeptidase ErfK/SrfK